MYREIKVMCRLSRTRYRSTPGKFKEIGLGIPRTNVFFPSLKAADRRLRTPQKTHTRDTSEA